MDLANNGDQYAELLQAQSHVWNHIFSFINSMSLKCATDLGIIDIIHNQNCSMTISELIAELKISAEKGPFIHRLMRILVHTGFFTRQKTGKNEEDDEYSLTSASLLLLKEEPMSMLPFLNAMFEPVLTKAWYCLAPWLRNDMLNPFFTENGTSLWGCAGREPKFNQHFNEAMASDSRFVSTVLMSKQRKVFEGVKSLVDVGGGTGTMAKAITDAFPNLECTVYDLPHVVADLKGRKNMKYEGGDMFVAVPPADAYLLKWILHDWTDEECVKILENCKEAMKESGKLIIIDMVRMEEGDESIETHLLWDMLMMVTVSGKERNEKEWSKLFSEAGFSSYKTYPILGARSLIEVYP